MHWLGRNALLSWGFHKADETKTGANAFAPQIASLDGLLRNQKPPFLRVIARESERRIGKLAQLRAKPALLQSRPSR